MNPSSNSMKDFHLDEDAFNKHMTDYMLEKKKKMSEEFHKKRRQLTPKRCSECFGIRESLCDSCATDLREREEKEAKYLEMMQARIKCNRKKYNRKCMYCREQPGFLCRFCESDEHDLQEQEEEYSRMKEEKAAEEERQQELSWKKEEPLAWEKEEAIEEEKEQEKKPEIKKKTSKKRHCKNCNKSSDFICRTCEYDEYAFDEDE